MAAEAQGAVPTPDTTSTDYQAMTADWTIIEDIRAGARVIRDKGETYLPSYEKETRASYQVRLASAPWRPEFVDGLESLTSRPFTKRVRVNPDAPDLIQGSVTNDETKQRTGGFVDDVDGQGNNLHVFSREFFTNAVARGLAAVLVDFPTMQPGMTLADERASGARPYWVEISALDIIALYFRVDKGRSVVEHMRIKETLVERDGFGEREVKRVRVYELAGEEGVRLVSGRIVAPGKPVWQVWESKTGKDGKSTLELVADGVISLPQIPIALQFTGLRSGHYRVKPPLIDLANTQLELYRALSRKDEIMTYAGSPMLKFTGMSKPKPTKITRKVNGEDITEEIPAVEVSVGPKTVFFCPPTMEGVQTDADYIQPNPSNIKEVRDDVASIIGDMQRLALQPTLPRTGTLTATGSAIDAAKAHSKVEAWANGLADTLDQAMVFTCQWLSISDNVTVEVHTDFGVDLQGTEEAKVLLEGSKTGTRVISRKTVRSEWSRRGLLGPNYDESKEDELIAEEDANDPLLQPQEIDPVTGQPLKPAQSGAPS